MISFLRGKLVELTKDYLIVDVNGVGYRVHTPSKALDILAKQNGQVNLFTKMLFDQREGTFELFGFLKREDVDLFDLLTSISGIGPRKALTILSSIEPEKLLAAVVKEDANYLKNISGLGDKTSKRLIVELRDKIIKTEFASLAKIDLVGEGETIDALMTLGYQKNQAVDALAKVPRKIKTVEEKVKEALKILSANKK